MLAATLNHDRRLGVEYEMTVPLVGSGSGHDVRRTLSEVLNANGLRAVARGYTHDALPPGVDLAVESDSSVQGETRYAGIAWHSVEIKSRILSGLSDWEAVVPKMLDIAKYMGARTNATCGHHVHVSLPEVSDRPKVIRSLTSLVSRIEPVIFGLIAPSRRHSSYCAPLGNRLPDLRSCKTVTDFSDRLVGQSRYFGLNLTHVTEQQPRVEYRYHQGTLDPVKARHWLRLLLQITQHAVTRNCQTFTTPLINDRVSYDRMATAIGLRVNSKIYRTVDPALSETARFLLSRWKHFNTPSSPSAEQAGVGQVTEREVA